VGTYNGLQMGPLRTNVRCGGTTGMLLNWRKRRQRGIPLEAAAVIGGVPAVSMTSVARIPLHLSEHEIAGGLMGEPLPVVQCETIDLAVPVTAEIVLEGEIPTDEYELDGTSGEHTGYTILNRLGFPPLTPRDPWYGYELGNLSAEYQRHAEMAERGEFEQAARILMDSNRKVNDEHVHMYLGEE
jgi:hypothetical protein